MGGPKEEESTEKRGNKRKRWKGRWYFQCRWVALGCILRVRVGLE